MKIGEELPGWVIQVFLQLLVDENVEKEASQIVRSGVRSGRTKAEHEESAIKGLALQYAIAEWLISLGFTVELAPPDVMHYDLIVQGLKVDVKTRWHGKYWQQSEWEKAKIEETGDKVLYLCIDVFQDGKLTHEGQCWSDKLQWSEFGCPWVQTRSEILRPP